jgi:hypothetical protein
MACGLCFSTKSILSFSDQNVHGCLSLARVMESIAQMIDDVDLGVYPSFGRKVQRALHFEMFETGVLIQTRSSSVGGNRYLFTDTLTLCGH